MIRINKQKIVKILTEKYPNSSEEIPGWYFINQERSKADWECLPPQEKQQRRQSYLEGVIKPDEPSRHICYYGRMIEIYDMVLDRINRIEKLIGNAEFEKVDTGLLRLYTIFLLERDYMDETILPNKHLGVNILRLAKEFARIYSELNLTEFAETYTEMFKHWPGKPISLEANEREMNESTILFHTLHSRLSKIIVKTGYDEKISHDESLAMNRYMAEAWKSFDPYKRQDDRRLFLNIDKRNPDSTPEKRQYYEKMVSTYDLIIDLLEKIKILIPDEAAIKNAETGLLRLTAIILIAKDYMDKEILPKHHLRADFIEAIAREMHETHPNLKLPDLAKTYTEMYELWPNRLS